MARTPRQVGRPRKPRAAVKPGNMSRSAGAPAPESAASTSPGGFYNPSEDEAPHAPRIHGNRLSDTAMAQITRTQAGAIDLGRPSLSADRPDVGYEPGENLDADIARIRALQRPLGVQVQKLALPRRSGYHTHWFNGEGGRIDAALASGWSFRKDNDGKPLKRAVGFGRDKGVLFAFAMDIPEVFWLEDMSARHKLASDKMEGLKAAPFQAKPGQSHKSDAGKFYSPVEGQQPLQVQKI